MSSIALVIFFVDCTLRMRRRRTRSWPPAMGQSTVPVSKESDERLQRLVEGVGVGQGPGRADVVEQLGVVPLEVLADLHLKAPDLADRHLVGPPLVPA